MRIKLADIPLHERTAEFFKQAVESDWFNIAEVPVEIRTEDMCVYCLSKSRKALAYVPDNLFTPDVCIAALKIHGVTTLQDYQMVGFTPAFKAKAEGVIQSLETFVRQFMPSLNIEDKKAFTLLLCNPCNEDFNLDYYDLLLTCAEIAARKSYSFRPTILDGLNQFTEYLKILKTAKPPCRERFTVYTGHTFSGEIQIDSNGKVQAFFADSLSLESLDMISLYIDSFKQIFNGAPIYYPKVCRQKDSYSCIDYAMLDLMKLHTIERYLPKRFSSSGLFGYLAASAKQESKSETSPGFFGYLASFVKNQESKPEANDTFGVTLCDLPLPFMRSSQNLFEENIKNRSAEEKETPVDKKGLKLTWEAAQQHFFKGDKNIFLRHKVSLRRINILAYIQKTRDLNVIREAMNSFTLEGFKKRYSKEEITYPSLNLKVKGMR